MHGLYRNSEFDLNHSDFGMDKSEFEVKNLYLL